MTLTRKPLMIGVVPELRIVLAADRDDVVSKLGQLRPSFGLAALAKDMIASTPTVGLADK